MNELKNVDISSDFDELLKNISINSSMLSIYQLDSHGNVSLLDKEYGIPSDSNYLNNWLEKQNSIFDYLLDKEQELLDKEQEGKNVL